MTALTDERLREHAQAAGFAEHPAWGELFVRHSNGSFVIIDYMLIAYGRAVADAAVQAEREACAKLCEEAREQISHPDIIGADVAFGGRNCCTNLAKRIRARGAA